MRWADELSTLRGWSRTDDPERAWAEHQRRRTELGPAYAQLIVRLRDGTRIGESFFVPLPEGFSLDPWVKPEGVTCLFGDIKLLPQHWGQGLGTEAMHQVVIWLFGNTHCSMLAVPPHGSNIAAVRVYEKAGFTHTEESRSWEGHRIMVLSRTSFLAGVQNRF
jgi:RimJ/RimL family protein N-acetyltransferase